MKKSRNRRKRILLRLQHILTGAAVVCVAVIALLLVNALRGNEISGPGRTAGSALFASGGERFVEAGEEARIMAEQQGEKAENVGTESADSEQEKTDTENTTETGLSPEKLAAEEDGSPHPYRTGSGSRRSGNHRRTGAGSHLPGYL